MALSNIYKRALDKLLEGNHVNPEEWITEPRDFRRVVAVFDRLLSEGHEVLCPDDISNYLESKEVVPEVSMKVQKVYEALAIRRSLAVPPLPFTDAFWDDLFSDSE
jgi:hypothetical protein